MREASEFLAVEVLGLSLVVRLVLPMSCRCLGNGDDKLLGGPLHASGVALHSRRIAGKIPTYW
jgi:hypothetical protein